MTIKLYKLITGEEVIGQLGSAMMHGAGIEPFCMAEEISKPFAVVEMFGQNGQAMLLLRPYFRGGVCDLLILRKDHIVQSCEPQKELADAYRQQISGIQIARV